jgi:hypothetical protein
MTGREPIIRLNPPVDCSKGERQRLREMVLEAAEVEEAGLDGRIARAELLVFLRLGVAIVGVGADR